MATFTKLKNGEWGVKVQGTATPGQIVTVKKKSGETKSMVVDKVIWTGNGVSICSVNQDQTRSSRGTASQRAWRGGGGEYCYYPCPVSGLKCCPENGPCHDCQ